ncbi:MAG: extracellular solute-binding protein [Anaerolineae bacterium]
MELRKQLSRRFFLQASGLGVAGLALVACQPTAAPVTKATQAPEAQATEAPTAAVAPKEKVKVRFMDRPHSEYAAEKLPGLIKDSFMAENPDIEVSYEPAPDQWEEKLITAMAAGNAVDIFQAWPDIFYQWTERNLVLDVQPYVDKELTEDDIKDYIDAQWKWLVIRGIRVGMPKYVDMRFILYNKDLFDKQGVAYPPQDGEWDWNDYTEMAADMTIVGDDGKIKTVGTHIDGFDGWFLWTRSFGGEDVNPDNPEDCWMDKEETQEAYNWIWQNRFKREPHIFAKPEDLENLGWWAFAAELLSMVEMGLYPRMWTEKIGEKFKFDVAHRPKGPVKRVGLTDADAFAIWSGSKVKDQAWQLIKWLSFPYYQENGTLKIEGACPVRKSLLPKAITTWRETLPLLENVRLEVVQEQVEWGYGENVYWFKEPNCAAEIIGPAKEKVLQIGEADPSYFAEICAQVEACQTAS